MRKMTITLDEEVAQWARLQAAEQATSVSRLVGEMLRQKMVTEEWYRAAQEQFLSVRPRPLRKAGRPLPRREVIQDRAGLR